MSNTVQFEAEKSKIIEKIDQQEVFLAKVLENNHLLELINAEQIQKLSDISDKNQRFLYKLKSNEFEIAIVGLEKAGKSTFANALIENNVLPSAPERCTFTSTRLVSGSDKARVEFYTEEEFNHIFQGLLAEIGYPSTSFRALSPEKFEQYFVSLEEKNPNLYKSHVGKTDEEIKDILKNRDKLILKLNEDVFQAYIRGEQKGQDTSKPRSVKKIEIESSKLKQLDTAIIYDVPGFDSPTKIHIRQTEERLKQADAIILVTNVGRNPSIQGTSLSVINKNADEDGISLKDKLFVFGNQIDTANSVEQAQGNREILIKDVEKYKIGERKRVFTGSALKYLVDKKIAKDEHKTSFTVESGIDDIRYALIQYYETERFEILKRKIDTNKKLLQDVFEHVLKDSELVFDVNFSEDNEKSRIIRASYKEIESNIKKSLEDLKSQLKQEINDDKFFSNKFKEDIENFGYFQPITEDDLEQTIITEDDSLTTDIPVERINHAIRKKLHGQFLKDFSLLIKYLTDEKAKEIEIRILRTFSHAILGEIHPAGIAEQVELASKKLIHKITVDIAHNEHRFDYLIERFSRDIFDILISYPLLSHDRANKFSKASEEFIYLDNYYSKGDGSLISIILAQKKKNLLDSASQVLGVAHNLLNIANRLNGTADIIKQLKDLVDLMNGATSTSALKSVSSIHKITEGLIRSDTPAKVLIEINTDIKYLKDILQVAVVPAINLELAFLNGIDKQIKLLIDSFQSTKTQHSEIFDQFISQIVPLIKKSEIDSINAKIETHKLKKAILEEIKAFI